MCGGLDENGSHRLVCLNALFPVGGTVWEGLGGAALSEEVSLEVDFEVSKAHAIPHSAVCYGLDVSSQLLPSACLPSSCHIPRLDGHGLPTPYTVSKPPDGILPFKAALAMAALSQL